MWLLSIAIILVLATCFAAYLAEAYTTDTRIGTFAKLVTMLLVIVSVVSLFIATGWKVGLAGIGGAGVGFGLFRVWWRGRLDKRL